ncbi:MAG: PP2C family protein-serine/threonine phosphatase [Brevinematales bacterium]|nr:PP2C family protein-serine/threonine phosphatase [Brevinematales bacterium]
MSKNPLLGFLDNLLNLGVSSKDEIQKVRLIRQVNGLNIFYIFLALGIGLLTIFVTKNSFLLSMIQFVAALLYLINYILNSRGNLRLASILTIHIFEWHLFLAMILTFSWNSPIIYILVLHPLLAALVEVSLFRHLIISLSQGLILFGLNFFVPGFQVEVNKLFILDAASMEVMKILSVFVIPIMAAVIINIIYQENVRARAKQKMLTDELSDANKQLGQYASQLEDEASRLRVELQVAKKLQTMVLPSPEEISEIGELEIACIMRPADEVGGDYYDIIKMGERVIIAFGDVTGHGLHSGIIMMMAQTAIRTLAENNQEKPSKLISVLNRILYSNINRIKEEKNMTLCVMFYSPGGHYILSGQHESLILYRNDGKLEYIDTMDLGYYVGMLPDIDEMLKNYEFTLAPGEVMIIYSDGITEAENSEGEQFGLERLEKILQKHRGKSAEKIKYEIIKSVYNFMEGTEMYDDISLIVLKQK